MSRTYRRKNVTEDYEWALSDYVRDTECKAPIWRRVEFEGKERAKALRVYHSDAQRTMNQVPSWFVNEFCNRPFRAKMKREVKTIMKRGGDYEDYNFDPFVKTALWNWW